jgi:hypothetical protein
VNDLSNEELALCARVAAEMDALCQITQEVEAYEPAIARGDEPRDFPVLHLDDVSEIPFLEGIVGMEFYQLRARVRAGDGDLFAATCAEVAGYESYNQGHLGLGSPAFVHALATSGPPSAVARACQEGDARELLVRAAREAGGLCIHPYMGATPVWRMALDLSDEAGVPVTVLAPPPPVTWLANDKAMLTRVAQLSCSDEILGGLPTAETIEGRSPEELGAALRDLATRHERVALKMTRCASAMGNEVFDSDEVLSLSPEASDARVSRFLKEKEWTVGETVLAVQWFSIGSSPSTQLWVPPLGEGMPRVDGVYEQLLEGDECVFVGSVPSRLGADMDRRLCVASLRVARVFQELGYVGRCSFDFVISGADAFFVECNGRWGGTSTPMHLLDRLFPKGRPAYRARDYLDPRLAGVPFPRILEAIGAKLYDHRTGVGTYVLYNVGCLGLYGKFDVIALGEDIQAANRALEDELPLLLEGCLR